MQESQSILVDTQKALTAHFLTAHILKEPIANEYICNNIFISYC